MVTNGSITLYNKYLEKGTGKEMYKRTVIKKANWQGPKGSTVIAGVVMVSDIINIIIPLTNDFEGKTYTGPKAWSKLVNEMKDNYFTLQIGDKVVKGECDYTYSATTPITNLSTYDDVVTIMSADINDIGGKAIQHFAIGGK